MKIPLADVIAHRHLLSSREAATLTLAVGRQWDRKQARVGDRPLPEATHIELSDGGAISFVESPVGTPATGVTTLSGLLGQLLGIDDQQAPHQPPSSREDGFRNALLRFADEDPGVLAKLFTRIVRPNLNRTVAGRDVRVGRRVTAVLVAAAVALLLSVTGFLIGAIGTPMPVPPEAVTQVRTPMQLVRPSADASTPTIAPARKATTPARSASAPAKSAPTPTLVRTQERKSPDNRVPTIFAGGSRAITWSQTNR